MLVNLNEVLKKAQAAHYGVGLFNTIDLDMAQAVIEAAEERRSPVIIGTAEILLPYGELKLLAPSLRALAEGSSVPVVLHYDHGLTFQRCMEALQLGFSSIMFDGSLGSPEDNMAATAQMVRIAHAMGATVEGEIGHVGQADGADPHDRYTTPEEATGFVEATGVDALAIAIGTAHGEYKEAPKLDIPRLQQIRSVLDTPLVLHGGSGLSDDDFRNTIAAGITKVNIFTDLCLAGRAALVNALAEGKDYLNIRSARVDSIRACVMNKIDLFGSAGKA